MKHRQKMKWYLCGMITAVMIVQLLTPALALVQQTFQVYTGINIYVNDVKLDPKDANGNTVPVFAYNGTTYLPVRAISNALGIPILWEGETESVYVGAHSTGLPASTRLTDMEYLVGTHDLDLFTKDSMQDNMGATHTNCIYLDFDRTYRLNGQYTKITGTLFQSYEDRHSSIIQPGWINIYGDGKLLYSFSPAQETIGWTPEAFSVDLTGVLELRVEFNGISIPSLYLGEATLWTV